MCHHITSPTKTCGLSDVVKFTAKGKVQENLKMNKKKKRQTTNHVDIRPLFDQASYHVFTEAPGSHVQRRHPIAVNSIDIGAVADENVHTGQGHVAHQ